MRFTPQFNVTPLNAHYEGVYGAEMLEWRRLGAIDKAANLKSLLGAKVDRVTSVLEVGCGTGAVLAQIAKSGIGSTHVGVDMADPNAHIDPLAVGLDLRMSDGAILPFPDGSFDLVVASHVLEHVPDERGFLTELLRVSRRFIYIEVPCEITVRTSATSLQEGLNIGHINPYTPQSFALTLATSGVHVEEMELFDHSYDVHKFGTPAFKARVVMGLRQGLLSVFPKIAGKIFVYHCGALCSVAR
jgi:SAM-dependent methyltransferase